MKKYKALTAFLFLAAIALWVSNDDYKVAAMESAQYCENVRHGSHPDYKTLCD